MFPKCFGNGNLSNPTVIEGLCRQISLADLRKATNNFDESRVIGRGEYGKLYKGYLQHNNYASDYAVSVKRFKAEGWEEFKTEVELLCQLRHPNFISLIGFCNDKNEKIIVYEYMSNGSLDSNLEGGKLSWKKRLEICIGVARGLHYLHAGAKRTVIHRYINPSNILLDYNMHPKLAGFGLAVQGARFTSKPKSIKLENVKGTIGYIAPEHLKDGIITDKSDVYSFGVILLEVVWGRTLFDMTSIGNYLESFGNYLENPVEEDIDPTIAGRIAPECWQVLIDITKRCLQHEADERPIMGEVDLKLQHALWLQEQADISNTTGEYIFIGR
ncbi:hypothetical protein Fmac_017420 [Flemingia macrophylla]|uniref:Protein kinase domain-containing protein n=1 Tax=Flemingia macrophylla TaxID=520843 RepID=A0ABD1M221_9FABA